MKFRFRGSQDCPDWVLAEIATISKLTSIKTRQITSVVVDSILSPEQDQNQVDQVKKLTGDKFSENDNKAVFALINFILTSAGKFEADPDILESELQQLGLPRYNVNKYCICKHS